MAVSGQIHIPAASYFRKGFRYPLNRIQVGPRASVSSMGEGKTISSCNGPRPNPCTFLRVCNRHLKYGGHAYRSVWPTNLQSQIKYGDIFFTKYAM
jgi:hypothetical protein